MKRIHLEQTDSTNNEARRLFDSHSADELDGTVITAGSQSAGKGRVEGRRFFSPAGTGLYMSLILKLKDSLIEPELITPAAGVAVCRTIEKLTGQQPQIKWVNDVFLNGKKVCGILTEGIFSPEGGIGAVIVGIGVNVREPESGFPEDLRDIVTAVVPQNGALTPDSFLEELLAQLSTAFEAARTEETVAAYQAHSLVVGKRVTVLAGNETYLADVLEVTKKCHLIVCPVDGNGEAASSETRELLSGEVSLRF
ncbi:MAG: biotin--[acetyl-CoA-carboxylase] ligase [Treponema sp.]|nr:biotin--[acetyl-CoA-carboxylase] ligase [Candidatus Treponema caballi]